MGTTAVAAALVVAAWPLVAAAMRLAANPCSAAVGDDFFNDRANGCRVVYQWSFRYDSHQVFNRHFLKSSSFF